MKLLRIDGVKIIDDLPTYRSNKTVHALQISDLEFTADGGAIITPVEQGFPAITVDATYIKLNSPKIGGYYMEWVPGYQCYLSETAFNDEFTKV